MSTPDDPNQTLILLGAPIEEGAGVPGASMGPAALRIAGLHRQLVDLGFAVEDRGGVTPDETGGSDDVQTRTGARNWNAIAGWTQALSRAVHAALSEGGLPIILGGDHSLSIGSINGVAQHCRDAGRPLTVLWLDAHADFNTPATSPSGNLHGMSVAAITGEPDLIGLYGSGPRVPIVPANIHLFGVRSIDPGERALLKARGINVTDMRALDEAGVVAPLRTILDHVARQNGLLHVSLDVDFLDPSLAPGVGTTVPGGATYREAHLIMEMLHDSGLVGSVDVVELNPFLDDRGKTALLMVDLLASLFGRQIFDRPTVAARAL